MTLARRSLFREENAPPQGWANNLNENGRVNNPDENEGNRHPLRKRVGERIRTKTGRLQKESDEGNV